MRVCAVAVAALVAALVLEWSFLVPAALLGVGAAYALHLALADPALQLRAAALAALLLLAAELAYWSLEERDEPAGDPGDRLRRLAVVLALTALAVALPAGILALVDVAGLSGLALDLLGAAAAAGVLLALALAARGRRTEA